MPAHHPATTRIAAAAWIAVLILPAAARPSYAAEGGSIATPGSLGWDVRVAGPDEVVPPEPLGEPAYPEYETRGTTLFPGGLAPSPGGERVPAGLLHPIQRPAAGESWLVRPFSADWFVGGMEGSTLVSDWVDQETGFYGGFRLGWDYDPHWGCEMRLGFASLGLCDSERAIEAQRAADLARSVTAGDAEFYRFDGRSGDVTLWDVDLLWYPWGEVNARPYFFIGLGAARVAFVDRLDHRVAETVFQTPIGIGVKYLVLDWLALRLELADNYIVGSGSGFRDLNNISLTGGMEVRFGGSRTAYWPYNPGLHYW